MGSTSPVPVVVELNTSGGYEINPVTGDSIKPIVNSLGNTVITGVPLSITGRTVDPRSTIMPEVIPAGVPRTVPANQNKYRIPDKLITKPVQIIDPLSKNDPEMDSFALLNARGDTLATGIPVPIEGRIVSSKQARPLLSIPPGIKDKASVDIKYLDVYHGMISSQVISLLEDSRGNIWFGSTGGGAGRYDGKSLMKFTGEEGLSGSWITSMMEDSQGRLWFGTLGEGVIRYDGENFTHFTEEEGLSNNTIEALLEDSRGNVWIGTERGVSRLDGENIIHYSKKEGLGNNRVLSIVEDSQGKLWFGTGSGVNMFDGNEFRLLAVDENLTDYPVSAILEDRYGLLWFGTQGGGVRRYDGKTYTYLSDKEGMSYNSIESIIEDRRGNLWFGTAGGGACRFDGKIITHFTDEQGLSGNWIIALLEDSSGNLWFGSIGDGVSIYNGQRFSHLTENEGLSSRAIYSVMEDSRGNLWFGTMFGGVCMFDGESYSHYNVKEGLAYITVESIFEDSRGNLWFGLGAWGVNMFDGHSFTHFTGETGFSDLSVGSILEDGQGNMWFGTYGDGLFRYNDEGFTHYSEKEGLSNNLVESMLMDSQGNLWIGTMGGVSMYSGESITHFSEREGLSSNLIGSIMEDSHGLLWFGTMTGGAIRYDGKHFTYFTEKEGLSDDHVKSIVEDGNGNIWISTDQGLNLIEFESGEIPSRIHSFGLQDGLKGVHFLQNSVLFDRNNQLWWGSNRSLTLLDLNTFEIDTMAPVIHLSRIDVNGAFVDYRSQEDHQVNGMEYSGVASYYNYPLNLTLSYNKNHLSFHYYALDWTAPQKIRYSYRMTGLNENWSFPTTEIKADYRNLTYGSYTFMVRAIGEAQIWSEPLEYTFTIAPPWWHSWWARTGYGILSVLLVIGIVNLRTARLKKRQKELELTVMERTEEIADKNEELEQQNVSLASQRDEIREQKQAITDSIEYARRIQTATLPPDDMLERILPEHFVFYKPLQIVSGDFYWLTQIREQTVVAVADCTGHGVPGAFMSMLGSALLNDIVSKQNILQANLILNKLSDQVIKSLRQTGKVDEARDGMDIALCIIDEKRMELQYAGAYSPLYHIRDGNLNVTKANRMPIGISSDANLSFTNHVLSLQKGDAFYMFSDGYLDQLGGEKRKKFKSSRFKSLLLEIQDMTMKQQKEFLESTLDEWMGLGDLHGRKYEQIDDIVVMGIQI